MDDELRINGVRVDTQRPAATEVRTIQLPSGRSAQLRKGYGRDLMRAQRAAPNGDPTAIVFALIAELAEVDSQRLVYEEVLEMELADVLALQAEVIGENFQGPPPPASPDSSGSASGRAN
ncbi:MAG: hypothetical protein ACREQB_09105 [Candidatus Binataceae bacterium]